MLSAARSTVEGRWRSAGTAGRADRTEQRTAHTSTIHAVGHTMQQRFHLRAASRSTALPATAPRCNRFQLDAIAELDSRYSIWECSSVTSSAVKPLIHLSGLKELRVSAVSDKKCGTENVCGGTVEKVPPFSASSTSHSITFIEMSVNAVLKTFVVSLTSFSPVSSMRHNCSHLSDKSLFPMASTLLSCHHILASSAYQMISHRLSPARPSASPLLVPLFAETANEKAASHSRRPPCGEHEINLRVTSAAMFAH